MKIKLMQSDEIFQQICACILQALIHGLNRHYYSIAINYRKNELEQKVRQTLRNCVVYYYFNLYFYYFILFAHIGHITICEISSSSINVSH